MHSWGNCLRKFFLQCVLMGFYRTHEDITYQCVSGSDIHCQENVRRIVIVVVVYWSHDYSWQLRQIIINIVQLCFIPQKRHPKGKKELRYSEKRHHYEPERTTFSPGSFVGMQMDFQVPRRRKKPLSSQNPRGKQRNACSTTKENTFLWATFFTFILRFVSARTPPRLS